MKIKTKPIIISIIIFILVLSLTYLNVVNKKHRYLLNVDDYSSDDVYNLVDYDNAIKNLKNEYNNSDVVGILKIKNTNYMVPILQGKDNVYYLTHLPNKEENYIGSVFLDYRVNIDNSKKLIIYGHNSATMDIPFTILEKFYDKEYYDNHKYIEITTSKERKLYEIFSVYVETSDFSYMDISFNDDEFLEHINKLKNKSLYDTDISLSALDEILILQTCSRHQDYNNYKKKYLLIISRRVLIE